MSYWVIKYNCFNIRNVLKHHHISNNYLIIFYYKVNIITALSIVKTKPTHNFVIYYVLTKTLLQSSTFFLIGFFCIPKNNTSFSILKYLKILRSLRMRLSRIDLRNLYLEVP